MLRLFFAAVLIGSTASAYADGAITGIITKADTARLTGYDATRAEALKEARAGGDRADIDTLDAIVAAEPEAFADFDLTGDWQCRTIKLGGDPALVVYGWFKCRVSDDGSGWFLSKINGSQRTQGRFYTDSDARLIYLGTQFVAEEEPQRYGAGPETDQVGYAFRSGDRFRIEFPAPYYESKLDILELRR